MIALILKDIATLKKALLLTVAISVGLCGYGIYNDSIIMIPLLCAMIPLMLTSIAFGYDVKSNFDQFAFSMPIKKSSYVLSKLFFAVVFGVLGAATILILLLIKKDFSFEIAVVLSILTFAVSLLTSGIQLPFILKYGADKGRLIIVVTYFMIFSLSSFLKDKTDLIIKGVRFLNTIPVYIFLLGILVIATLLVGLLINLSISIMKKKEY